jgi:hypothetical protein
LQRQRCKNLQRLFRIEMLFPYFKNALAYYNADVEVVNSEVVGLAPDLGLPWAKPNLQNPNKSFISWVSNFFARILLFIWAGKFDKFLIKIKLDFTSCSLRFKVYKVRQRLRVNWQDRIASF